MSATGSTLLAHAGSPVLGALTVGGLLLAGALYAAGARLGRTDRLTMGAAAVAGAALLLAGAGPVDRLAAERFSVHMVQHLLLTAVAAPAIVLARPHRVLPRLLSRDARRAVGAIERRLGALRPRRRWFTWQVGAALAHAVVLGAWHVPGLYEAALAHPLVHGVEHLTLLASAVVLWGVVVAGARQGAAPGAAAALFLSSLSGMALAALLTFAADPLYPTYVVSAGGRAEALADQQAAGGLMWVPGKLLPLAAAAAVVVRWLARAEGAAAHPPSSPRSPAAP